MEQIPSNLPVLPIRNVVLFPTVSMPLVVGRQRSLHALQAAEKSNGLIVIVTQRVVTLSDPTTEDLYLVGTLCKTEENPSKSDEKENRQIVVTGLARYRVAEYYFNSDLDCLFAKGEIVADTQLMEPSRRQALLNNLKDIAQEILQLLPGATEPLVRIIERVDDAGYLTNICASYLNLSIPQKQELLETIELDKRMELLLQHMQREREVLGLQQEIRDKMSERLNKAQREALLREQLRTIRSELGDEAVEETAEDIEEKLMRADMPEEPKKQSNEELKRLRSLPPTSPEYHVVRTYLEWLAAMPWKKTTQDNLDITRARAILDEDHYGLENVKRRILQFLAVARLKNDLRGPILCLVGPPGVGKTSLGQSIARTLGRKFIRTTLGGVRDEAEIRGHRRTYVGAMPGRIIQSIKRAETRNPLMMLDEIDKLSSDFHGDPSSAMLEVLDPEQNKSFVDHYLDVPFDLSDVFFVATANIVDTIPPPLRDRMEMIEVNGYTTTEKLQIAKHYLLPRELKAHGFQSDQITIPDETLLEITGHYTREAGVRELQRKIAALLRAMAQEMVEHHLKSPITIASDRIKTLLGPERFFPEVAERRMKPGVATGLAWTAQGGDILFIEATLMSGKSNLILTGQLGDVMKESAQIALSLARTSNGFSLMNKDFDFASHDIHIHVPAGSIPKDGPSAGVAILVALISLLRKKSVDSTLGLSGEITLRGAILPVGGIKEKILAAHRAGLKTVVLPKRNEQDLVEVPEDVRKQLSFIFAETVEEVLHFAFKSENSAPRRLNWIEAIRTSLASSVPEVARFAYPLSESLAILLLSRLPKQISSELFEILPQPPEIARAGAHSPEDSSLGYPDFICCTLHGLALHGDSKSVEAHERIAERIVQVFFQSLEPALPRALYEKITQTLPMELTQYMKTKETQEARQAA